MHLLEGDCLGAVLGVADDLESAWRCMHLARGSMMAGDRLDKPQPVADNKPASTLLILANCD